MSVLFFVCIERKEVGIDERVSDNHRTNVIIW